MYTQLQLRDSARPPVNVATLGRMKAEGEKISSITCYDASFAALVDEAGVDVVLVGDSLGMVIQGHDTTVPVTLDHIIYHCKAVSKGLYRRSDGRHAVHDHPRASRRCRTRCG
jgi:3-methyl-2-oxobutanoate hydroxymethyltransferase